MNDLPDTQHLELRGNIWHYRRRVPTPLVSVLGKQVLRQSLETSDLKLARRRRNELNVKAERLFAEIEAQMLDQAAQDSRRHQPSLGVLIDRVRADVVRRDRESAESLRKDPPESEEQRREMITEAMVGLSVLSDRDNPNAEQAAYTTARRIAGSPELPVERLEHAVEFFEIIRRGLVEVERRRIDRLGGDHSDRVHDALFRPDAPRSVTFGELAGVYWAERVEDLRTNKRSEQRVDKIRSSLDFLVEAIGEDTPVDQINDDTVQSLRRILSRLPANRKKLYPDLTIAQALEHAERDGVRILSPTTQRTYLDVLREALHVGVRKQFARANVADGVEPIRKETLSAVGKRRPWTNEQIVGFFTGGFYRSCAPGHPDPYTKPDRGWRFWIPLLMLFLGARPNEIAQLHFDDLKQTSQGTLYLNLIDDDSEETGKKTVKTDSSRRRVPMHPELIKIGFLAFVEERKKTSVAGNRRLFPELTPNKYGNTAYYAARRLREHFIPREITLGPRQTLYSLRHNVRDALRRVEAPADTLLSVAGWSPAGKAVEANYGDPGNPDFHAKWVAKIAYPGLDLSFLHRSPTVKP